MKQLRLIVHNVRSAHNVGSLLRTADGFGIAKVYLTGYTPYPIATDDERLPHIAQKVDRQIHKTALGAEGSVPWQHTTADVLELIAKLQQQGISVVALEQTPHARSLPELRAPLQPTALIVGNEITGLEPEVLSAVDYSIEIPMHGKKESFNVAIAGAVALYQLSHLI